MAEQLGTYPHQFDFIADNRAELTFVGDVRLDPRVNAVTLKADDVGAYPTTGEHYVLTSAYNPRAVRQWIGFQSNVKNINDGVTTYTSDTYRLHDGTTMRWWDGAAWSAASLDTDWNTEQEIADNISTFPVTSRTIRIAVRLETSDKRFTPSLSWVKLAWTGKVFPMEDILYRSLVPMLRDLRVITDFAIKIAMPGGLSLNVGAAVAAVGIPFDVVNVDAVFNNNTDPDHYNNLLSSYDTNTKIATLGTAVPVGQVAFVRLIVRPQVALDMTSQDYIEVEKAPALQVVEIEAVDSHQQTDKDSVVNKGSGATIEFQPPYRFSLRFTMIALAPGGTDLMRLVVSLVELMESNPTITSVATGEKYRLQLIEEFRDTSRPNAQNLHSSQATAMIHNLVAFTKPARNVTAVGTVNANLS